MYVLSSFSCKSSKGMYCEQICDTSSLENSDLRRDFVSSGFPQYATFNFILCL